MKYPTNIVFYISPLVIICSYMIVFKLYRYNPFSYVEKDVVTSFVKNIFGIDVIKDR